MRLQYFFDPPNSAQSGPPIPFDINFYIQTVNQSHDLWTDPYHSQPAVNTADKNSFTLSRSIAKDAGS